jgi:DNA (cytosine-5)-methyltransferase 1
LWKEYLRIVTQANLLMFVIENVDRFLSSSEFQLLLDEADHGPIKEYELSYGCSSPPTTGSPSADRGRS